MSDTISLKMDSNCGKLSPYTLNSLVRIELKKNYFLLSSSVRVKHVTILKL